MKKLVYPFLSVILGVSLYSCDLDTEPSDSVDSGIVFENADNAEKVLNGTWSYLFDTYFTYQNPGWNSVLLASDAMSDDVAVQPGKYGYLAHYSFTNMSSTSATSVTAVWTLAYKTIDNMNNVISKIDGVSGDATHKAQIKAQAEALRGYIYLNLATFYSFSYQKDPDALSVPIYTEPATISTEGKSRSPLKDVYKQAETDLLAAYNGIGDFSRGVSKHKINKSVISGLLARLYLQTNQWELAQKYASEGQEGSSWMAKDDYSKGFNDVNNAEWIWGHGQTPEQSTASYSFQFKDVSSKSSYYYSFMADPYFRDFFDNNDIRTGLFEWDTQRYKGGLMYKKFLFRADGTADIVLMRKAELVLIEAEAYAEQNKLTEAINKLNELRGQRGADTPDLTQLSKAQLVDAILIERRKELFGEGFGLSDILRRQKSVERKEVEKGRLVPGTDIEVKGHTVVKLDGKEFTPNNPVYLFAIPAAEATNNPNL